jgi:hypothetical protein
VFGLFALWFDRWSSGAGAKPISTMLGSLIIAMLVMAIPMGVL